MALFRKFFYRKPPDGLLEISERIYVFDSCFTTDVLEDDKYQEYVGDIVSQLRSHFLDASFMVFNFREGESQSLLANILSSYDMTVMDYPRQYEGCPLLTTEMIHHFLRSGESWLSLGQHNVVLMHCERGGWAVLAFMLAALLLYRKQFTSEPKTLEMIYKQAPRELIQLLSPLNPMPSQLRYLHYVSRRNVNSDWPPLDRALTLDCIILRNIPSFNGEGGCRPIFRIYGQDPLNATKTSRVLFSTPKKRKYVWLYKQVDCEFIKIDVRCHIQGDVVLECISLDADQEREEMMFRVMFNTAFIRSNILMLNRDEIDILWDAKDRFPKEFRAEVLLSEMDATNQLLSMELAGIGEKEGLPIEAFVKVQEMFNSVDWLDPKGDAAVQLLQRLASSDSVQLRQGLLSPGKRDASILKEMSQLEHGSISPSNQQTDNVQDKLSRSEHTTISPRKQENGSIQTLIQLEQATISPGKSGTDTVHEMLCTPVHQDKIHLDGISNERPPYMEKTVLSTKTSPESIPKHQHAKLDEQYGYLRHSSPTTIMSQCFPASRSSSALSGSATPSSPAPSPRFHNAPSALGITALLQDHAMIAQTENCTSTIISPTASNLSTGTVKAPKPLSALQATTVTPADAKGMPPPPPSPLMSLVPADAAMISEAKELSQPAQKLPGVSSLPPASPPSPLQSTLLLHATGSVLTKHQQPSNITAKKSSPTPNPPPPLALPAPSSTSSFVGIPCRRPPPPSLPSSTLSSSRSSEPPPPRPSPPVPISSPAAPLPPPPPPPSIPMASSFRHSALPPPPPPPSVPTASCVRPAAPPPPPPPPMASSFRHSAPPPPTSSLVRPVAPPPPPPPPLSSTSSPFISAASHLPPAPTFRIRSSAPPSHPLPGSISCPVRSSAPPPPPPPHPLSKQSSSPMDIALPSPPAPPRPHAPGFPNDGNICQSNPNGGGCKGPAGNIIPPPAPLGGNAKLLGAKGRGMVPPPGPISKSLQSGQAASKRSNLKPLHWVKVTRAMQGSLWAETQKAGETSKAPVFDMSELENLFSAALPSSDLWRSAEKSGSRASGQKLEKIHLIDLRRANNCGIMLTKVKMPLSDLMSAILALDDTVLDADQVDNLIKFTPTKEEMELLKCYQGDKQVLGECEQYFIELMQVPRVESKLRVFSFKIQFRSQVSDLKRNLNIVNSSAEEIRGSMNLKKIMQTILSLGNALNQGTARGSAVGFRLDSLLKLSDTRARNNKMTLMHYLCKVVSEKLPELLAFPKDLVSLELAAKIQLKSLAEEMQAINKGLEKVEQELTASENDGPISQSFRRTLKEFLHGAEAEVRALTSLYSNVGRNADALALYFGEDPARCPFEQVVSTLLNFVRMFTRAHEENCKQLDLEKKKAQKVAESEKAKLNNPIKELDIPLRSSPKVTRAK